MKLSQYIQKLQRAAQIMQAKKQAASTNTGMTNQVPANGNQYPAEYTAQDIAEIERAIEQNNREGTNYEYKPARTHEESQDRIYGPGYSAQHAAEQKRLGEWYEKEFPGGIGPNTPEEVPEQSYIDKLLAGMNEKYTNTLNRFPQYFYGPSNSVMRADKPSVREWSDWHPMDERVFGAQEQEIYDAFKKGYSAAASMGSGANQALKDLLSRLNPEDKSGGGGW